MTGKARVEIVNDQMMLGPVSVSFQRTLRIPETGLHPLPPGLGRFPLRRVEDYPATAPAEWLARGGVMLPIYQREAMWLSFGAAEPSALQVGVGKVCAVSGLPWIEHLVKDPQNYVVLPDQPLALHVPFARLTSPGWTASTPVTVLSASSSRCPWAPAPRSRVRSQGRRPTAECNCGRWA